MKEKIFNAVDFFFVCITILLCGFADFVVAVWYITKWPCIFNLNGACGIILILLTTARAFSTIKDFRHIKGSK